VVFESGRSAQEQRWKRAGQIAPTPGTDRIPAPRFEGSRREKRTLIKKLILSEDDMKELATKLEQACGTGGTVKDGMIEIQGENRERIADVLKTMGYKVKMAGG